MRDGDEGIEQLFERYKKSKRLDQVRHLYSSLLGTAKLSQIPALLNSNSCSCLYHIIGFLLPTLLPHPCFHPTHLPPDPRNTANLSSLLLSLIIRPQVPTYSFWPFNQLRPFNMAIPDHNHNHHNSDPNAYEDPIDQWLCSQCFKTISSSRPPNFNSENCSCIEVSSNGPPHTHHLPHPSSSPQPHYENTTHPNVLYQHTGTQSYASSAISFIGPEGPERKNPNLRVSNAYLPLGPGTGHGEVQHRRTASFESEMSPQMRRFLIEGGYDRTEHVGEEGFLKQDVKISASRKVHRGSKPSWVSSGSRGSGLEESFGGWSQRLDWTRETGAWMDEFEMGDGDVDLERGEVYEYPMIMSEVTECGFGDGGN